MDCVVAMVDLQSTALDQREPELPVLSLVFADQDWRFGGSFRIAGNPVFNILPKLQSQPP